LQWVRFEAANYILKKTVVKKLFLGSFVDRERAIEKIQNIIYQCVEAGVQSRADGNYVRSLANWVSSP
jgi:hypothetical protein